MSTTLVSYAGTEDEAMGKKLLDGLVPGRISNTVYWFLLSQYQIKHKALTKSIKYLLIGSPILYCKEEEKFIESYFCF